MKGGGGHLTVKRASALTLIGGMCLGSIGVILKVAYGHNYPFLQLTLLPVLLGMTLLWIAWFREHRREMARYPASKAWRMRLALMACGSAQGASTLFYFLALQSLPVSIVTVLVIQYFWIIPVWKEWIEKAWSQRESTDIQGFLTALVQHRPSKKTAISWVMILVGTFFAMELYRFSWYEYSKWGFLFAFLTAISDSCWMLASGRLHTHLSEETRSTCLMTGSALSLIVVTPLLIVVGGTSIASGPMDWKFGVIILIIAMIGYVIPTWSFAKGLTYLFSKGKSALASCLPAIELPFGILIAMILLAETVHTVQWLGILLILLGTAYQAGGEEMEPSQTVEYSTETTYIRMEIALANLRNPEYITHYIEQKKEMEGGRPKSRNNIWKKWRLNNQL